MTWGATYTIMSHANLYSSLCALMIVGIHFFRGQHVTKQEIIGSIIGLMGCVVTNYDPEAGKVDDNVDNIDLGNFLCFFSSIFATIYILKGQELTEHVSAMHYLFTLTSITVLFFFTFFPIAYWGKSFTFSMDVNNGLFGWL